MVQRSTESQPSGWALVPTVVRQLVHQWRHPAPLTLRYLHCAGCGMVTRHGTDQRLSSVRLDRREVTASPPEAVCDLCGQVRPRAVGGEVAADVTVACVGRRYRPFGIRRSRRLCGRQFTAPSVAPIVLCPWCATTQPNPAHQRPQP